MQNQKLENLLNLALSATKEERMKSSQLNVGYNTEEKNWELIIKFSGDLSAVLGEDIPKVELLNQFAIIRIPESRIEELSRNPQIEFVEKPKRLFFAVNQGKSASCMTSVQSQFSPLGMPLTGKGILVACVDSGIDYSQFTGYIEVISFLGDICTYLIRFCASSHCKTTHCYQYQQCCYFSFHHLFLRIACICHFLVHIFVKFLLITVVCILCIDTITAHRSRYKTFVPFSLYQSTSFFLQTLSKCAIPVIIMFSSSLS